MRDERDRTCGSGAHNAGADSTDQDAESGAELHDRDGSGHARAEQRVLLTRNTRLLRRRALPPHVFVHSDDFRLQLKQVVEACGLRVAPAFLARCVRCNTPIENLDRAAACTRVPEYVCETQTAFARCPSCGRIYWPATHVARMRRELARMGLQAD